MRVRNAKRNSGVSNEERRNPSGHLRRLAAAARGRRRARGREGTHVAAERVFDHHRRAVGLSRAAQPKQRVKRRSRRALSAQVTQHRPHLGSVVSMHQVNAALPRSHGVSASATQLASAQSRGVHAPEQARGVDAQHSRRRGADVQDPAVQIQHFEARLRARQQRFQIRYACQVAVLGQDAAAARRVVQRGATGSRHDVKRGSTCGGGATMGDRRCPRFVAEPHGAIKTADGARQQRQVRRCVDCSSRAAHGRREGHAPRTFRAFWIAATAGGAAAHGSAQEQHAARVQRRLTPRSAASAAREAQQGSTQHVSAPRAPSAGPTRRSSA